ncbi:MAG: hypothetical protein LBB83_11965, partial [Treponema sp.]|nr:hypothetical protein [Treponema sp.]
RLFVCDACCDQTGGSLRLKIPGKREWRVHLYPITGTKAAEQVIERANTLRRMMDSALPKCQPPLDIV